MPVNLAMLAKIVNTKQLDTFSAFLNMPNMSIPLYQKIHNDTPRTKLWKQWK